MTLRDTHFAWLEITGKCQLECRHCYADSGPHGTHGTMTTGDWRRVIDQLAAGGVELVQFVGGEPTLHSDLPALIGHARGRGLRVEVFTNLVHISETLWAVFQEAEVTLATSYYSDDPQLCGNCTSGSSRSLRTGGVAVRVLPVDEPRQRT